MKIVATEFKDSIIYEVWCASMIVFEGHHSGAGMGLLCCIDRVNAHIQFSCVTFELVYSKERNVKAMILSIDGNHIRWLSYGIFCCLSVGDMDAFVKE